MIVSEDKFKQIVNDLITKERTDDSSFYIMRTEKNNAILIIETDKEFHACPIRGWDTPNKKSMLLLNLNNLIMVSRK